MSWEVGDFFEILLGWIKNIESIGLLKDWYSDAIEIEKHWCLPTKKPHETGSHFRWFFYGKSKFKLLHECG